LINDVRSATAIARAMQDLHVELLFALQFNETHRSPAGSLSDRFGVTIVILLRLDVKTNILWRQSPNFMNHSRSSRQD
jgi:hypothetical protein